MILRAVVTLASVLVVASSNTVTTFAPTTLVDVITGISGLAVVDDAFMDRSCLVPSGGELGINRGLFLLSGGLRRLLRCKPTQPRGDLESHHEHNGP
jgi:hypothetical protein